MLIPAKIASPSTVVFNVDVRASRLVPADVTRVLGTVPAVVASVSEDRKLVAVVRSASRALVAPVSVAEVVAFESLMACRRPCWPASDT